MFTPELTIGGKLESFFSLSLQIRFTELVRSSGLSSPGIRKLALNVVQVLLEQSRYSLVYLLRKHMYSAMLPDFFFCLLTAEAIQFPSSLEVQRRSQWLPSYGPAF